MKLTMKFLAVMLLATSSLYGAAHTDDIQELKQALAQCQRELAECQEALKVRNEHFERLMHITEDWPDEEYND